VRIAHDDAQADDIDEKVLAGLPHRRRQLFRIEGCNRRGQLLGNRNGGEFVIHQFRSRVVLPNPGTRFTAITTAKVMSSIARTRTAMAPRSPDSLRSKI